MLLTHLFESNDDLPLLARVILGRIAAGDKIRVKVSMPSEREDWWGPLQNVRLGTPMKMNPGNPISVPRLFIHWRQGGEIGHSTSQWVRADTFDDRFELVKDEHGVSDWVLKYRPKRVSEAIDDQDPLLVTLIDRKLEQGMKVILNIKIAGLNPDVEFKHAGVIRSIGVLAMRSPQMQKAARGSHGVQISYVKENAGPAYKGYTDLILPVADFDELYGARPIKSMGQPAWMVQNVRLNEIQNDDDDLFIQLLTDLLKKKDQKVFVWKHIGQDSYQLQIDGVDATVEPVAIHYVDPPKDEDGIRQMWDILDPDSEWTISKIDKGWLIHEVD